MCLSRCGSLSFISSKFKTNEMSGAQGGLLAQVVVRVSPTDTPEKIAANMLVQVRVLRFMVQSQQGT